MVTSKQPNEPSDKKPRELDDDSALSSPLIIFTTALDTTWRIFVPVLGGVFAGIGLDTYLSSKPVATIICLILGTVMSGWLIARQIRAVRGSKK